MAKEKNQAAAEFQPCGNRVLIRPDAAADKSVGGILIPDVAKEKPRRGTVLSAGPGSYLEDGTLDEPTVKPGDAVLYRRHYVDEVEIGMEELVVIEMKNILGTFTKGG